MRGDKNGMKISARFFFVSKTSLFVDERDNIVALYDANIIAFCPTFLRSNRRKTERFRRNIIYIYTLPRIIFEPFPRSGKPFEYAFCTEVFM